MAKQTGEQDIVLEDVTEPDNNSHNTNGYPMATYPAATATYPMATYPTSSFPTASYSPQQFSFGPGSVVSGGWGGHPMATVPVVMMTQNGEPVVTQVAYM